MLQLYFVYAGFDLLVSLGFGGLFIVCNGLGGYHLRACILRFGFVCFLFTSYFSVANFKNLLSFSKFFCVQWF